MRRFLSSICLGTLLLAGAGIGTAYSQGASSYITNTKNLLAGGNFNIDGSARTGTLNTLTWAGIGVLTPVAMLDVAGSIHIPADSNFQIGPDIVLGDEGDLYLGKGHGGLNNFLRIANWFDHSNTFLGDFTGSDNTTGSNNVFVGESAGADNTTGTLSTYVGYMAGNAADDDNNTFVGGNAGLVNDGGIANTFAGASAGVANTTGQWNTFLGHQAGNANTTSSQNTFVGKDAGLSSTGASNTFMGRAAGSGNVGGGSNVFLGEESGFTNGAGNNNTFTGYISGKNSNGGNNNSFYGYGAGQNNAANSSNTLIGYSAQVPAAGVTTNATAIGALAEVDASNSLVLGSINGTNGATANTNVGIGTTTPAALLQVTSIDANAGINSRGIVQLHQANQRPFLLSLYNDANSVAVPVLDAYGDDAGNFLMGNPAANNVTIYTNGLGNPRVTILGAGNVGINTTTPAQQLEVNGKIQDDNLPAGAGDANMVTSDVNGVLDATPAAGFIGGFFANAGFLNTYIGPYAWLLGGNALAAPSSMGTTTAFDVNFITSNTTRINITAGGAITDLGGGGTGAVGATPANAGASVLYSGGGGGGASTTAGGTAGAGGNATLAAGQGGGAASSTNAGANGGAANVSSGTGGLGTAAKAAGSGGTVSITAGSAGAANSGTGGAGGAVSITAGAATGSGNNNGGNISLTPGAKTGTGTAGAIVLAGPVSASASVGTSGQVLTSGGPGVAPSWTAAALTSTTGVEYNVGGPQNTATPGTNNLFNVAYAGTPGPTSGAVIGSAASGTNSSATGLTITASSTGTGLSTGLSAYGIGDAGGYHVGLLGAANATPADVNDMIGGNWTRPFAAGIVGFTPDTGADKYAGYFLSQNNTPENTTLNVASNPGNSITPNSEMFAAIHAIGGNDGSAAADGTQLYAEYNYSEGNGPNVQARGSLSEAQAESSGLGASAGIAQASGTTGLADYTPNPVGNAPTSDFIVGVRGATYTEGGETNGLNVVGMTFDGAFYRSVGGYFFPTLGSDANLGVVGQVGGTENQAWQDAALTGTNASVVGMNYTTGANQYSGYFYGKNSTAGSSTVKITSDPGVATTGADLFAVSNWISGTDGVGTGAATGSPTTLRGMYNNASSSGNNVRLTGGLLEASTSGIGLGASAGDPQATGVTGLTDYVGTVDAPTTDFLVGIRGATYTSSNKTNGLNIVGENFGGTYFNSVGGYFYPSGGSVSNLGVLGQIGGTDNEGWHDATWAGKNAGIAGINYNTGDNQFAGYFRSNNGSPLGSAVTIDNDMTTNMTPGNSPFGGIFTAEGTDGDSGDGLSGNDVGTIGGTYSYALTTSGTIQTQGLLGEAATRGKGLGSNGTTGGYSESIGVFGLGDYNANTNGGINDYVEGTAGSPYTDGPAINGIAISGSPYNDHGYYRMVAGYFIAAGGTVDNGSYHHANIGSLSQVGGTGNEAWRDAAFNDMNVAVAGMDYNTPGANERAMYTSGAVQMKGLTGSGTNLVTIDVNGNLGSEAAPVAPPTGVYYNVSTPQNTATPGTDNLFNVAYTPAIADASVAGAVINSTTTGATSANGLTVSAQAGGGSVMGLNASGTGGSAYNIGALGSAAATSTVVNTYLGTLPAGTNAGVVGFSNDTGNNNWSGYFHSNNGSTYGNAVRIDNNITGTIAIGGAPFGGYLSAEGTDGDPGDGSSNNGVGTIGGTYSNASTSSGTLQTQGLLGEAATTGRGLGTNGGGGGYTQAIGVFGLADYNSPTNAGATDYLEGVGASPNIGDGAGSINGIAFSGDQYSDAGFYRMIAGYFRAGGGTVDAGSFHHANIGTISQIGGTKNQAWRDPVFNDLGVAVAGMNYTTGANQYSGYFYGKNSSAGSSTVKITSDPGVATTGADLFAVSNWISGTDGVGAGAATGSPTTLRGMYNNASSAGNNVRLTGGLLEASTSGVGLGASADDPQATGVTGLTDYVGTVDAPTTDFLVGIRGATYTSSNRTNGLNIVGENFGGTYFRSVGGFFYPSGGTDANLGVVGQIGGTDNQAWKDAALAGTNASVVGMNYNAASSTNLAGYFGGNVEVTNTLTIGTPSQTGTLTIYDPTAHFASSITQANLTGAVNYSIPSAPTGSTFLMVDQGTGVVPTTATAGTVLTNDGSGGLTWGSVASSAWGLTGNTGTTTSNFIGTTDAQQFAVRTSNTQRILVRSDGSIAMGNSVPVYPSNMLEVDLANVGGAATSGEQNQGLDVLASAATGSALSIALRGRMDVNSSATATSTRGVSGVATLSSGSIGSGGTGGLTGGYFFSNLLGGTVNDGSVITGVGADVDNTANVTTDANDEFIGGRFGANPTAGGTSFHSSSSVGMFATASGSTGVTGSNTGAFGGVNSALSDITAFQTQLVTEAATLTSGSGTIGVGLSGLNPLVTPAQYAGAFGGNVLLARRSNGTGSSLQFLSASSGTGTTSFLAGSQGSSNFTYTLPTVEPSGTHVLTDNGSGTLSWGTALTAANGVQYDVTAPQATATVGTDNLFNVGYTTTGATAAGAVINSTTTAASGASSATGLTLSAKTSSTGPATVAGLNVSATGDMTNTASTNIGIVATSNATSGQLSTFEGGLPNAAPNGGTQNFGAPIVAYNPNDGDNQYAAYLAGNNSNVGPAYASGVLRVVNNITAAIPGNNNNNAGQPTAGLFTINDNSASSGSNGNQAAPMGLYAEATGFSSPYTKVTGVFGHAWSKSPDGQTASGTMARAVLGFADGQNNLAAAGTKIIGVMGWTNGEASSEDNLLSVVGVPYPGMSNSATVPTDVGGYFWGNYAHTTNLGMVGQVGGSADQAWQDATLTGTGAAVVGINYNHGDNQFAGYFRDDNNSQNGTALEAVSNITTNLTSGQAPFAGTFNMNYSGTENDGVLVNTVGGLISNASTSGSDYQAQGGLFQGTTSNGTGAYTHAVAGFGIAYDEVPSANTTAGARLVGMSGEIDFSSGSAFSGIGVQGRNDYGHTTTGTTAGGEFVGDGGTTAMGVIGQVEGANDYEAYHAASLTGRKVGVVAWNGNGSPTANDLALYSKGQVQMVGLTGTGTNLVTIDGSGNLGSVAAPAAAPTGVYYDVTAQQATATTGTDNLFNVGYTTSNATAAGAVINSTTTAASGASSATGLTLSAKTSSTGPATVAGLNVSATGDLTNTSSTNIGVLATTNTTSGQLSTFEGGLPNAAPNGGTQNFGAPIVAYNPNDGDNQYAAYLAGNNSNTGPAYASGVLRVVNNITAAIPGNNNNNAGQPTAGLFTINDNSASSGSTGNQAAPMGLYAEATGFSSPYTKVTGVFGHAWTKSPDGQTASGTMARAVLGFADGQNNLAAAGTKIIGVMGWTNGEASSEDNLLSVVGVPYPGMSNSATVPTDVGGYFFGNYAHTTNLGMVGQVGGSGDQAWQDASYTGQNVAVVGMNYGNVAGKTGLAGYFGESGDMTNTGSSNIGVLATSNTTSSQLSSFESGLNTLGTNYGGTETADFGASVVGYNPNDGDNQYAAYFEGNNSNQGTAYATGVLRVVNNLSNVIPSNGIDGGQPTAGLFSLNDNVSASYDGTNGPVAPVGVYSDVTSSSPNSEIMGMFTHPWTHAVGAGHTQAVGLYSYTVGTGTGSAANSRVIGVSSWADAPSPTSNYNLIGVEGGTNPYGNTESDVPRSIGGYFIGQSAASANVGVIAQVGGSTNEGWEDANLTGKNVAMAAINYNTPSATDLAGYFGGNVVVTGSVSTGNHVIASTSGTGAASPNVTVSDVPVFVITGAGGGAITMPASPTTGDVIIVINNSSLSETYAGVQTATITSGNSRTFYYDGSHWQ